jgi:hypothetical protein
MWTTQDGHHLVLTRERFGKLAGQMRGPGLSDLVRCNYDGALTPAVMRSVAQLIANSVRAGNLRHVVSGHRYPVFIVRYKGKKYLFATKPVSENRYSILGVFPAPLKNFKNASDTPDNKPAATASLDVVEDVVPNDVPKKPEAKKAGSRRRPSSKSKTSRNGSVPADAKSEPHEAIPEFAGEDDDREDYTGPAPWYSKGVTIHSKAAQNGASANDEAYSV